MANKRITNFEILRVLCMFFIVLWHFGYHGTRHATGLSTEIDYNTTTMINLFIFTISASISAIGVNCFILISSYFICETTNMKLRKIISVWVRTSFYSGIIYLIFCIFSNSDINDLWCYFLPIQYHQYWFITTYIGLMLLSPYLSKLSLHLSKAELQKLLIILILMNITIIKGIPYGNIFGGPTSIFLFITLFFTAAYLKLYGIHHIINRNIGFIVFSLLSIEILGGMIKALTYNNLAPYQLLNNNSMVFFTSIAFFLWFKKKDFPINKITNILVQIAPYTLGIYLIHDNDKIREWFWNDFINPALYWNSYIYCLLIITLPIAIFLFCLIIDIVRAQIFKLLQLDKMINKTLSILSKTLKTDIT